MITVERTKFTEQWDRVFNSAKYNGAKFDMTAQDYIDHTYNTGYKDAIDGHVHRANFTEQMSASSMEEDYERGWTDGQLDRQL